jgi:hypothetical protein
MSVNFTAEDRRAIDLLMDRRHLVAAGGNGMDAEGMSGGFTLHETPVSQERLVPIEGVLELLSMMPVEEPPAGLVERTLAWIDQKADGSHEQAAPFRSTSLDNSIPHA